MSGSASITGRSPAAVRAAVGSALHEERRGPPSFARRDLMAMAEAICHERDWGDNPGITDGLDKLLHSFETEAGLDALGRKLLHQDIVRWLCNWLKLQTELRSNDRIIDVPISRPVFIVGLARTGSTLLHSLLSLDEKNRTPRFWELLQPHPAPRKDQDADSRRIAAAERALLQTRQLSPQVLKIHQVEACAPDECHYLLEQTFISPHFCLYFNLPSYLMWLEARTPAERQAVYRCYRRQIQHLQLYDRRQRWVSKTLVHQYFFPELVQEFPDARIVRLHRDPGSAISSYCSLLAQYRSIYTPTVDPRELGETVLQLALRGVEQMLTVDKIKTADIQFCDVFFEDILEDPIAVIKSIYDAYGYEIEKEYVRRLHQYLVANPRDKNGVHRHQLAEFGLDRHRVNAAFQEYIDWVNNRRPVPGITRRTPPSCSVS